MIQDKIYKALNRVLTKAGLETLTQANLREIALANNIDLEVDVLSEVAKQKFLDAAREYKQDSYQLVNVKETVDITPTTEEINENQVLELENNQPEEIKPAHSLTTVQQSASDSKPDKANALVFVDPFSKALAVRQSVANSDIQLTDSQVFELSTQIPNQFSDQADLTGHILAFVHEKYDLESLRSRLIIDESLEELRNKQQQFRLETSLKVKKTFDIMHENTMSYREADEKLLQALKDSYQRLEDKRNKK
jgi:hypothetical protein